MEAPPRIRPAGSPSRSRRPILIAMGVALLAVVALGGYGLWYLFLQPAGPAAVADTSLPPVPTSASGSSQPAASSEPSASSQSGGSGAIDGTWNVDTSIGSFADSTSSFVGYRVQEQLASIGANTAVGRTPNVSGSMTVSGTQVTTAAGPAQGPFDGIDNRDQRLPADRLCRLWHREAQLVHGPDDRGFGDDGAAALLHEGLIARGRGAESACVAWPWGALRPPAWNGSRARCASGHKP